MAMAPSGRGLLRRFFGQKPEAVVKRPSFDTVIEGDFTGDPGGSFFKITRLELPPDVTQLRDSWATYVLHGVSQDYGVIRSPPQAADKRLDVGELAYCPGILLPYREGGFNTNLLSDPRAVVTADGRIFLQTEMLRDADYLGDLSAVVHIAGGIFADPSMKDAWQKVPEHQLKAVAAP